MRAAPKRSVNTSARASVSKEANTFQTVGETFIPLQTPGDIARMARQIEATRSDEEGVPGA